MKIRLHEETLEALVKRRCRELGVCDSITPHVLSELQRRELDEGKAFSTAGRGGKGSGKKRADIRTVQSGRRFRSSQRQHSRSAGKALDKEVKELAKHLIGQITDYQDGKLSYRRLEARASIAFKGTIETVFRLGAKAVGLTRPSGALHDPTPSETKWLKSYVSEELGYFKKFLRDIRRGQSEKQIKRRVESYANALRSVYESGRVLGVGPHVLIYWVLDKDQNNCPDCIELSKHNPYTVDTLPTTPKGGQTRCRAYCYCTLRIDQATPAQVKKSRKGHKSSQWLISRIKRAQRRRS